MKVDVRKTLRPRGRPRSFDRGAALERAMKVFWRHGFETTSISDLKSAIGINSPSLYAAFGNKENLFLEAVARYQEGPGTAAYARAESEPTARAAVRRLLESSAVEFTRRSHPVGCMVVVAAMNCSARHLQARLKKFRSAGEAWIRARIRRGVAERELRPADGTGLARFFMTVLEGMTIQARDGATREQLLAVAKAAMGAWPGKSVSTRLQTARRA
jgi:AcrR family transcriptional regulator